MTKEELGARLREFLIVELGVRGDLLKEDTPLMESGMIDSVGVILLVAFCEENLGCAVSADEIAPEAFHSLAAITHAAWQWRQG